MSQDQTQKQSQDTKAKDERDLTVNEVAAEAHKAEEAREALGRQGENPAAKDVDTDETSSGSETGTQATPPTP